jgi:hypothetical protein
MIPASRRTGHLFAIEDSEESAQKIEIVFSASPETTRMEPQKLPSAPRHRSAGPGGPRKIVSASSRAVKNALYLLLTIHSQGPLSLDPSDLVLVWP